MAHVQGPDYPTNAEIITPAMTSAKSTRPARVPSSSGRCGAGRGWRHRHHGAAPSGLRRQDHGADCRPDGGQKLPMVTDLQDESDHENPTRLVIVPRSNRVDVEADGPPVRHHGSGEELPGQPKHPGSGQPARQVKDLKTISHRVAEFSPRDRASPPAVSPRQGAGPPAHPRRLAHLPTSTSTR